MDDRELLEAAAKAAGIDYDDSLGVRSHQDFNEYVAWNPLTDDGDALRLAVKLRIAVDCMNDGWVLVDSLEKSLASEPHAGDPYAATRRAIVRAAAAMAG